MKIRMTNKDKITFTFNADLIVQEKLPAVIQPDFNSELNQRGWETPSMVMDTNCYAFGTGNPLNGRGNPGDLIKDEPLMSLAAVFKGIERDGLIRIEKQDIKPTDQIAILMVRGGDFIADYHWLRREPNGRFKNKFPGAAPTDTDTTGAIIVTPETADFGKLNYAVSAYYKIPETGITMDAPLPYISRLLESGMAEDMNIVIGDDHITLSPAQMKELTDKMRNPHFLSSFVDPAQHEIRAGRLYAKEWDQPVKLKPGGRELMEQAFTQHVRTLSAREWAPA